METQERLSCFLCKRYLGNVTFTLDEIIHSKPIRQCRLFTIQPGKHNEVPSTLEQVIGRSAHHYVTFSERKSIGSLHEGRGRTFQNENDSPTLHVFGDRVGQTILVCNSCCEHAGNELINLLDAEYGSRLGQRVNRICRILLEKNIVRFDAETLKTFVKEFGSSVLSDSWTATLKELNEIAVYDDVASLLDCLRPLIDEFIASGHDNSARLKLVS